jgi:hypothetical protein
MPRLPVSGQEVRIRPPDGTDDLLLLVSDGNAVSVALGLLARIAEPQDGGGSDWAALAVTDFELLLAALRVMVLGEHVACAFDCPRAGCGARCEVRFRLADYLAPVRVRAAPGVSACCDRPGWFVLDGAPARLRLPTAADQRAVLGEADAARLLGARCLDPPDMAAPLRARAERAMAAMAPEVSRPLSGTCPGCGARGRAGLHLPNLVVTELRRAAAGLHEEVHLLASAYHWQEVAILALPRARRLAYAERARERYLGAA